MLSVWLLTMGFSGLAALGGLGPVHGPAVLLSVGSMCAGARFLVPAPSACRTVPEAPGACLVPPGEVRRCSNEQPPECRQERTFELRFDRLEVTVAEFATCVEAGRCRAETFELYERSSFCNFGAPGRQRHPMNCVQWDGARDFCRFAGKRLPTRAEWLWAARGDDKRLYPWGDEVPDCRLTVFHSAAGRGCGTLQTRPAGATPAGASPYGILDLSGNVMEWTSSVAWSCPEAGTREDGEPGGTDALYYVEGGSFADDPRALAIDYETVIERHQGHIGMGIRCVVEAR